MLKGLFYDETHACKRGSGLVYEVYYAFGSIAVGQEVVNEQYVVAFAQKVLAHADVIVAVLCERVDRRGEHVFHRYRLFLLGKHHRQLKQIARHYGRGYAAGFNGYNLVDVGRGKPSDKLHSYRLHQDRVHLMVDKAVNLQDAALKTFSVAHYALFQ